MSATILHGSPGHLFNLRGWQQADRHATSMHRFVIDPASAADLRAGSPGDTSGQKNQRGHATLFSTVLDRTPIRSATSHSITG